MATSYPSGLDSFTNPTATDSLNSATVPHATQHANANDAIEAIQAELGTDPAGASATVKARFDAIEAAGWVTSTRILDGTIVDGDINAAAAIAQSKVANLTTDLAAKAPLASPTFTGTVTTPLTTAGYVKTDSGGVLSSSAAIAQADVTNLTSDLAGKVASTDLAYAAFINPGQPVSAGSGEQSTYLAAVVGNIAMSVSNNALTTNYFEWTTAPIAAGTYLMKFYYRKAADRAIITIKIDGTSITTVDAYAASTTDNNVAAISGITLTAGRHTVRMEMPTKNASASAYGVAIEGGVWLNRTGA